MSSLPPATRHSLVDSAIDILKSNITSGIWRVGQRIPTEPISRNSSRSGATRCARRFARSRIPACSKCGDGTYVRRNVDPAETMRDVDRAARDHLELQCMLETECARAARRRTDEDLATLRKLLKARGEREASRDVKKFVERDRAFHIAVAAASHNHALEALYRYFRRSSRTSRTSSSNSTRPRSPNRTCGRRRCSTRSNSATRTRRFARRSRSSPQ